MQFTSLEYILFLPLMVFLYFALPHKFRWVLLLSGSYLFYMYWRPEFVGLLIISTVLDYYCGLKIGSAGSPGKKKIFLYLSLLINLGFLFSFKYLDFFNENLRTLLSFWNINYPVHEFNLILPIGISFYTFQSLSYTIDIYRNRRKPEKHIGVFALYVSFFPQLVAGPIERSTTFLPQLFKTNKFKIENIIEGGKLVLWGLFKKIVLADYLALYVNDIYGFPNNYKGIIFLFAAVTFVWQLYLDFSAYSDIAIGSARMFGYELMTNFDRPLKSKSLKEFWNRWHISMTQWFYDYLYRPLRRSIHFSQSLTILIFFTLIGLWHGAGWGFFIFGFITGVFLVFSDFVFIYSFKFIDRIENNVVKRLSVIFKIIIVFVQFVVVGIFFRISSIDNIYVIYSNIFNSLYEFDFTFPFGFEVFKIYFIPFVIGFSIFIYVQNCKQFNPRYPFDVINNAYLRFLLYIFIVISLILVNNNSNQEFIYFQF